MGCRKLSGKPDEMFGNSFPWGSSNTSGCFMLQKPGKLQRFGPLGLCTEFTLSYLLFETIFLRCKATLTKVRNVTLLRNEVTFTVLYI